MIRILLAILVVLLGGTGHSMAEGEVVVLDNKTSRSFHAISPTGVRKFTSDTEAQTVLDRIVHFVPMRSAVRAFVTDDAGEVPNAEARVDAEKRRIVGFNQAFMQGIKKKAGNDWSLISIAAHEIGHHAGNHNFLPLNNCDLNNELELEADFYAGFALGKMQAKLDEAVSALRFLPDSKSCTHPGRLQRIGVIKEGWIKATSGPALAAATSLNTVAAASISTVRAAANIETGSRFKLRKNRDVHGHDLETAPGVSFDHCALRCEKNAKCKGFSFDRWNGWCFLKDAMPGSLLDPASIIAVKSNATFPSVSTVPFEMHRLRNKRFPDKPLTVLAKPTYDACFDDCKGRADCVAFSYLKAEKSCQIFSETLGHFQDEKYDSGFKRQPPETSATALTTRMVFETDKTFKGGGYQRHEDASVKDCEALCLRDDLCKATEYNAKERICRLYHDGEAMFDATGTNVAYKRTM